MPEVGFKRNSPLITVKRNVYTVKLNDEVVGCEGWHALLNRKAVSGQLPFYKLLDLLHAESKLLSVMGSGQKATRYGRYHVNFFYFFLLLLSS